MGWIPASDWFVWAVLKQIGYMTDLTCFNAVMARLKNFVWLGGLQRGMTRGYGFD